MSLFCASGNGLSQSLRFLPKDRRLGERNWELVCFFNYSSFSYPKPFLRAVNGARRGALAKSISNWHLIGYNEGYCSNTGYILLPCFHGIRLWIWPEPLVAPRVRRALGTRMIIHLFQSRSPSLRSQARGTRLHLFVILRLTTESDVYVHWFWQMLFSDWRNNYDVKSIMSEISREL